MPADLTREEIERLRGCTERFRIAAEMQAQHRGITYEHGRSLIDDVCHHGLRLVALFERALSEPDRIAAARAEGFREGVEAVATALRREIAVGDGATRSLTWSEALDAVDALRALIPSAPPTEDHL